MTAQIIHRGMPTLTREKEYGHREYKLEWTIGVTDPHNDGPTTVLTCPGLPTPGSVWNFGNDVDDWAFCQLGPTDVKPDPQFGNRDVPSVWLVTQTFATRAPQRCNQAQFEDPLLEPIRISGSFIKYQEEAWMDRFGQALTNSAFERFRGQQVEFDRNRPQVKIVQNVPTFFEAAGLPGSMMDNVNAYPMWGLPPRTIKLSAASWTRKYWGFCLVYYERDLTFDINYETFDRPVMDMGKKVLRGRWQASTGRWFDIKVGGSPPNPLDPTHFIQYTDRDNKPGEVILDGAGRPAGVVIGTGTGTGTAGLAGINVPCHDDPSNTSYYTKVSQQITVNISGSASPADGTYLANWDGTNWAVWSQIGDYIPTFGPSMTLNVQGAGGKDPSAYGIWWLRTPDGLKNTATVQNCGPPLAVHFDNVDLNEYFPAGATGEVDISAGTGGGGTIHQQGWILVQKYDETDFTLLGIPLVFLP
jgi:hypothetical protein